MISKADKDNSIIITCQDEYHRKVVNFISNNNFIFFFVCVSLTMHLSITLDNHQLDAHIF
jgi:hypothetical protein